MRQSTIAAMATKPGFRAVVTGVATVSWTALADGTQTGYAIYYGTTSKQYTDRVDAGLVTSKAISGLSSGVRYYFNVQAYFANGDETPASDEVSFVVP